MNDKLHYISTYVQKRTIFLFHFVTLNYDLRPSQMGMLYSLYSVTYFKPFILKITGALSFKSKNMITWFIYIIPGFQLSTDVLSILVLRYMRKDGTLRFGDFVSAILHLSVAFSK